MQSTEIKPLDTFFFRNARPFSQGEDTWADGMFPPNPSVIYGAMRTAYLGTHSDLSKSKADLVNASSSLAIHSILLQRGKELLFHAPLDLVRPKKEGLEENVEERVVEEQSVSTLDLVALPIELSAQSRLSHILQPKGKAIVTNVSETYLNEQAMISYLQNADKIPVTALEVFNEPKIGIKLNRATRSTNGEAAGQLYRVDMTRLNFDTRFLVRSSGLAIPKTVSKLGGEGKLAAFEASNSNMRIDAPNIGNVFKVVLTTPCFFQNGWHPYWLESNMAGYACAGLNLKLLAAVTGKPLHIGGWDIKENKPKTMFKAVPPGAVYYFEILEGTPEMAITHFHEKTLSETFLLDNGSEYDSAKEGFGAALVGIASVTA